MAELTLDLRDLPKAEAYATLATHVAHVLEGIDDPIAGMATIAALVHHAFGNLWTGFYRVVERDRATHPTPLLRIGPYQGTLGCLEIEFGRGVCGTAAAEGRTIIVPDVVTFPGHIVCDPLARSEIVVPVYGPDGALMAVFDLDAAHPGAFGPVDAAGLETIVGWFGATVRRLSSADRGR
jgi:GAF domain-containing protein